MVLSDAPYRIRYDVPKTGLNSEYAYGTYWLRDRVGTTKNYAVSGILKYNKDDNGKTSYNLEEHIEYLGSFRYKGAPLITIKI